MRFYLFFLMVFVSFQSSAAIVLNATRIIYPEGSKEITVQAGNQGDRPFAAQVWVGQGYDDPNPNMPGEIKAPFFVTPSISRIAPNAGQSIRVVYTGGDLPSDRETIFYFNLLQIPPIAAGSSDKNIFQVLVKDQLKLFYRPSGIAGESREVSSRLMFELQEKDGRVFVRAVNPTGYYASFSGAKLNKDGKSVVVESSMIPPFSESLWAVSSEFSNATGAQLVAELVNDYGGLVTVKHEF